MSGKKSAFLITGLLPVLPNRGEVHLWILPVAAEAQPSLLERRLELLDKDERQQFTRFRFDRDRYLYLSAHALLRAVLSHYTGIVATDLTFRRGEHGKPYLTDAGDLFFNLSHTRGLVALAVGRTEELGADVECLDRQVEVESMARRYFATCEAENVLACEDSAKARRLFLQYWTLKEALVKAVGTGLTMPLDKFHFTLADETAPEICYDDPALGCSDDWQFWQSSVGSDHGLAVAACRPAGETLTLRQYTVAHGNDDALFRMTNKT